MSCRSITDNFLITHETFHYLRISEAKKYFSIAVKTNMSKDYDWVEWGFIRAVLDRLGFDPVWIRWTMDCVESVLYSFFINGTPLGTMNPSHGIRQGDSHSPYLFILCTEVLFALCDKAQKKGSHSGVRVSRHSPPVNHLRFADDTIFFGKSNAS